jgi:hypothetical protein
LQQKTNRQNARHAITNQSFAQRVIKQAVMWSKDRLSRLRIHLPDLQHMVLGAVVGSMLARQGEILSLVPCAILLTVQIQCVYDVTQMQTEWKEQIREPMTADLWQQIMEFGIPMQEQIVMYAIRIIMQIQAAAKAKSSVDIATDNGMEWIWRDDIKFLF